jgi:hypothetical protein
MSHSKFENGVSYYDITRKIEEFVDRHAELDSKQMQEENLREMLLYSMEYPEYMNYYDYMREAILENIRDNYEIVGRDSEFLTVCSDWLALFGSEGSDSAD